MTKKEKVPDGPGAEPTLVTAALLRTWPVKQPEGTLGKESRGQVLVVGGAQETPGGALLAGIAALRAGAGKLQLAVARGVAVPLSIAVPEARVIPLPTSRSGELTGRGMASLRKDLRRCQAILVGPGMRDGDAGAALLSLARRDKLEATLVFDAATICDFPTQARARGAARKGGPALVLTPNAGEMAKLLGIPRERVLAEPANIAIETARRLGVIIALKGPETFIAGPGGELFEHRGGNAGLGTSGSGDVLAGIIAGLAARGAEPLQAAVWGVFVHGKVGERLAREMAELGYLARELLREIPAVIAAATKA